MSGRGTVSSILALQFKGRWVDPPLLQSVIRWDDKNPKNSDTENIVLIILKFEQRGFTIEKCVQKM